jgi:hypothetical protein
MSRLKTLVAIWPTERYWVEIAVAGGEPFRVEGAEIRRRLKRVSR